MRSESLVPLLNERFFLLLQRGCLLLESGFLLLQRIGLLSQPVPLRLQELAAMRSLAPLPSQCPAKDRQQNHGRDRVAQRLLSCVTVGGDARADEFAHRIGQVVRPPVEPLLGQYQIQAFEQCLLVPGRAPTPVRTFRIGLEDQELRVILEPVDQPRPACEQRLVGDFRDHLTVPRQSPTPRPSTRIAAPTDAHACLRATPG